MLPMPELLLREESKRYNDQTAANICGQRWVEVEQQPVGDGDEENAQSILDVSIGG